MSQHYAETKYGFEWGAAKVQRAFSDDKRGWVTLTLETPKYDGHKGLQIYVTRTGKVRIHDARGEWLPRKHAATTKPKRNSYNRVDNPRVNRNNESR